MVVNVVTEAAMELHAMNVFPLGAAVRHPGFSEVNVPVTELSDTRILEIVLAPRPPLGMKTIDPSPETAPSPGIRPTGIGGGGAKPGVARLITVTRSEPRLETYAQLPLGVTTTPNGFVSKDSLRTAPDVSVTMLAFCEFPLTVMTWEASGVIASELGPLPTTY